MKISSIFLIVLDVWSHLSFTTLQAGENGAAGVQRGKVIYSRSHSKPAPDEHRGHTLSQESAHPELLHASHWAVLGAQKRIMGCGIDWQEMAERTPHCLLGYSGLGLWAECFYFLKPPFSGFWAMN